MLSSPHLTDEETEAQADQITKGLTSLLAVDGGSSSGLCGPGACAPSVSVSVSQPVFCGSGTTMPCVSALWSGVWEKEHRLGFFLPESSVPGVEEIIVFV